MNPAVRGEDLLPVRVGRRAVEAGDATARFRHDQAPGRHIPGVQTLFPKAVQSSGRHIAEIEGGRAEPPHGPRPADELGEQADHPVERLVHVVWEAGTEDRVQQC